MSDQPRQPSNSANSEGSWFVPGGVTPKTPGSEPAAEIPMPTNEAPRQSGGWYVPQEARARSAEQPVTPPITPEPVAPPAPEPATPEAAAPEPVQAATEEGDDASEMDYSNYVPGKGFVAADDPEGKQQPSAEPTPDVPDAEPDAEPANPAAPVSTTSSTSAAPDETNAAPGADFQPSGIQPSFNEPIATPVANFRPVESGEGPVFAPSAPAKPLIPAVGGAAPAASVASVVAPPGDPIAPATPEDQYSNVEAEVQILRRKYRVGNMTADELRKSLRDLMVLDPTGNWWMIGMESDRWYKYNGTTWLQQDPPGRLPSSSPGPTITTDVPNTNGSLFGTPAPTTASPITTFDEFGMPKIVSINDMDATMVGRSAAYLDSTLKARPGIDEPPIDSQATVAASGITVPSPAISASAAQPAIPSPGPSVQPVQPDYGARPTGLAANRSQLTGCVVRGALVALVLVLGCSLIGVIGAIGYYYSVVNQYGAQIDALAQNVNSQSQTLRIFDASKKVIAEVSDKDAGKRTLVKLDQISPFLIHATITTEDQRFYDTPGFDIIGIVRAVTQNLSAGGTVSGASSITQQLARALVFDPTQVASSQGGRKVIEIFVASEIARRYSKSQILEMYLNQIPYGNFSSGIEAAAQTYFGKRALDLNPAEAALLAGLPQSPSTYNPVNNREAAFRRMEDVLRLQQQVGCLQMQHAPYDKAPFCVTKADVDNSIVLQAQVKARTYTVPTAQYTDPHFVDYILSQLEAKYGAQNLFKTGYNVYTTLDPTIQKAAEDALKAQVANLARNRVTNGAVFATNPQTGAILAMVGSVDYNNKDFGQFNIVTNGNRQPGSSIKPFVYAGVLEPAPDGSYWTPATVIWDVQTDFNGYQPTNYGGLFRGPQSLRNALGNSLNIPAVRAMQQLGVDRFKNMADRVGLKFPLTQPDQAGLAAALGGIEVRLFDMVHGFGVFANGGKRTDPIYGIQQITKPNANGDGKEQVIFDQSETPPVSSQVINPAVAYLVTDLLSDNQARCLAFGCPNILQLADGRKAAVKTGTTNDYKDNWTVGYTPDLVVGVWVGNNDGTPMVNVSGITGAAPIWNQVVTAATRGKTAQQFPIPPGVAQAAVCIDYGVAVPAGNLAGCETNRRRNETFVAAQPPPAADAVVKEITIDTWSGLIANQYCPGFGTKKTFLTNIDQYAANWLNTTQAGKDWAAQHNLTLPVAAAPTAQCDANTVQPKVAIEQPTTGQTVSSLIQIFGFVDVANFSRYQVELAQASRPDVAVPLGDPIRATRPTPGSFLGSWDTNNVPDGNYYLRIHFYDNQERNGVVSVPVIVNNTNPVAQPAAPNNGQVAPTSAPFEAPAFPPTPTNSSAPLVIGPTATRSLFPPTPTVKR